MNIILPFRQLFALISAIAIPFKIIACLLFVWMIWQVCFKRESGDSDANSIFGAICMNIVILTLFLILLCMKIAYMSRIEASWGIWFYLILMVVLISALVIRRHSVLKQLLPLIVLIIACATIYPDGRFMISTSGITDYQTCVDTDNFLIDQFIKADTEDLDSFTLHAPDVSDDSEISWIFGNIGNCISTTLYNQGIISTEIKTTVIYDTKLQK